MCVIYIYIYIYIYTVYICICVCACVCTCAYLHANGSGTGRLLIWFEFGAFVVHGVSCATHSRLTGGFTLEANILKTQIKYDHIIIIIIKNIGTY